MVFTLTTLRRTSLPESAILGGGDCRVTTPQQPLLRLVPGETTGLSAGIAGEPTGLSSGKTNNKALCRQLFDLRKAAN